MILFLSDLHLDYLTHEENRLLEEFLSKKLGETKVLVLNGDLFDSPSRGNSSLSSLIKIIYLLKNFVDSGGEVIYTIGNHDIGMTAFVGSIIELNIKISYPKEVIEIDDRRFLIEHGHQCDPLFRTSMYDFLKIFEDRLNFKFGEIAEKLFDEITQKFQTVQKDRLGVPNSLLSIWEQNAFDEAARENADAVIFGHTHAPMIRAKKDKVYINIGSWIENLNYVIYERRSFSIYRYDVKKPELLASIKL